MKDTSNTFMNIDQVYISGLKLLVPLTLEETYKTVVTEGMPLVDAKRGVLYIRDGNTFIEGYNSIPNMPVTHPRKRGYAYQVFASGKPKIIDKKIVLKLHPEVKPKPGKTLVFIPLTYHNITQGVLLLGTDISAPEVQERLNILQLYGNIASMAIQKSLYEKNMQDAIRVRDTFISVANHELKTPITTVRCYADLIKKSIQNNKIPPIQWVDRLLFEVKRQSDLVNDMLVVDQIRNDELTLNIDTCDICELLESTVGAFSVRSISHPVTLENELSSRAAPFIGDENKLIQAFTNIINNAAKYSPPDTPIQIDLYEKDTSYAIDIIDHGPGISNEDKPHIFKLLYRGNTQVNGMGIGLYITKRIIDAHHGTIDVHSNGKGTTFTVQLPKI